MGIRDRESEVSRAVMTGINHGADIINVRRHFLPGLPDAITVAPGGGDNAKYISGKIDIIIFQLFAGVCQELGDDLFFGSISAGEIGFFVYNMGIFREADIIELDLLKTKEGRLPGNGDIIFPDVSIIGLIQATPLRSQRPPLFAG